MITQVRHYFLLAILAGAGVLTFFILEPFFGPLALGAIFAVILQPVYQWILARMPRFPSLAALATVIASVIVVIIPLSFIGTQLLQESQNVYRFFSEEGGTHAVENIAARAVPIAESFVPGSAERIEAFTAEIDAYTEQALNWLIQHLGPVFSGAAGFALDMFLFFAVLYFLLRDGGKLRDVLVDLSPLKDRDDIRIFTRLEHATNSVVKGQLTIALIQGFVSGIGYALFGIPNPALWGFVTAFAAFIPGVGTALILAPAVLFLAVTGSIFPALGLAIWGTLAVGMIDNMLAPYLIGSGMKLHPLLVLLSVLGGIAFFGPVGLFLGPLTLSLLLALLAIYRDLIDSPQKDGTIPSHA